MEKILILDSNSLLNRAFYALPPLTNSEGLHTNAIYGFSNMLIKMREDINPDYIVAAFDKKAPTFRHKEYGDYKAGRKKMPPELAEQFPKVKEFLELLGINIFEREGFEADDIIGTIAKSAAKEGMEVYIVTGDKDALQLADKTINVMITKKGVSEVEKYDYDTFVNKFEITPTQFIDVKGLMGDKSDNIPGVPGVGEKTAFKLIKEYGSIENVLMNIDNISGKKLKENLENFSEQAIFSKKLATIMIDVPFEGILEEIRDKREVDSVQLKELLLNLGMMSAIGKYVAEEQEEEKEIEIETLTNIDEIKSLLLGENEKFYIAYDINESKLNSKRTLNTIAISRGEDSNIIKIDSFDEELFEVLKEFFEDDKKIKVIHDAKALIKILNKKGIEVNGFTLDTSIAAYLIDSSQGDYNIDKVILSMLGYEVKGDSIEVLGKGVTYLKNLESSLISKIEKEGMDELYYNIEHPLIKTLADMENVGFQIDRDTLDSLEKKFKEQIEITAKEIYELAEEEFNIGSPKQLGKILFEKLDLPVIKKTKTGYSTNADVLDKLRDKHPIIDKITYYRQITKINSTYVEGLKALIDEDGRIHSSFNQTVTTTGRLSSTEPNLQNIPIRYEMGREIRKVFIPQNEDDVLLSSDYSQIELRVLAHMSGDQNMIDAFNHHSDIHTKTASEVFNVPVEEVTSKMRSSAKAVNFGIIYGISDFSLAQDIGVTKKEASEYMKVYFDRYPKIKSYLDSLVESTKENGYIKTILNRKRIIPEIKSSNKIVKSLGERLAMNAPIQGSAADIIKIAMNNVSRRLLKEGLKSQLILQVHDELILNVKKNEFDIVNNIVKEEMENAVNLKVPLDVDGNSGSNWYEAK